jgi:diguanylate cyclase (GGDEF)-like protein/PAS domain S-box-containing protein
MRRLLAKTPLSLILITAFGLQVSAAMGLTVWLSIRNSRHAVSEVAGRLRDEVTTRVSTEVVDLLTTTQAVNDLSARTLDRDPLDLSNVRAVEDLYWDYLNTFDGVVGLGLGNPKGDILGFFKQMDQGETVYFLEYSNADTQGQYVSLRLNDQRQVVQSRQVDRRIDARERPWYQAAIAAEGPVWTAVYPSVSQVEGHYLAMNASQPLYTETGQLRGVVSVILDLGQVSQRLSRVELSPQGQVFIVEQDGSLIGSSDGQNPVQSEGAAVRRLAATDSPTPSIRQAAAYLDTQFGGTLDPVEGAVHWEVDFDGDRHYLQVTPIQVGPQRRWWIVVVVPESDFLVHLSTDTRNTLMLSGIILVLATGSSVLTARWLTRSLQLLNRASQDIAQGKWEPAQCQDALATARAREVKVLAQSFMEMAQQLQDSFAALQASEANFRNMADNVPGVTFRYLLRPDGTDAVLYMSSGSDRLWEVTAQAVEQEASTLWRRVHPDDVSGLRASIQTSAQSLDTWTAEWRMILPSGRQKWLQANGRPTPQPDGAVLWHTVVVDVSDRKAAELALEVQRDFNELIANITSRFVDLSPADLDGEIERALGDICQITGVDTSYVFHLNPAAATFTMTHEWCQPPYERRRPQAQALPFDQFPWSLSQLQQRQVIYAPHLGDLPPAAAMDSEHWRSFGIVALVIVPLVQTSTVTGCMGFASFSQPITWQPEIIRLLAVMGQTIANAQDNARVQIALMESEARWQFALEGSGDGVWDWNAQTNTVFFSHQWKTMLGYGDDEIGSSLEEWDGRIHPDDKAQCYGDLERHFAGETPIYQNEHRVRCKDGTYKWILDRGKVIEWAADHKPLRVIGTHTDVTVRKQAEAQLQDLTHRLGLAVRSAKMGIWEWDVVGDRLLWDDRMYELYGLPATGDKQVLRHWEAAVHPEDLPSVRQAVAQALQERQDFNAEFRVLWPDGTTHYLEAHAMVQRDEHGQPLRMIGVNWDITERKQTALALEQELRLSKTLFDTSIDGIVLLDDRGNVLMTSASFAHMLGYTIEETYTLNLLDWDAQWSPEELQEILSGDIPLPPYFETRHRRKDGSIYDVEISYNQFVFNGDFVHFCICRDITTRKQYEAERSRLTHVLEVSLNEIYLFNHDTLKFEYVNQGALQNLGYSLEKLRSMTPMDIKPELSNIDFEGLLLPLRQGEVPKVSFETLHQRANGSCYPVEAHVQLTQYEGRPIFLAVILDVSDRKRAEAQLIHQALHDSLTDLPNRVLLIDRIELALKRAQQSVTYQFALLFLDLDQFKVINDSLGHHLGDQLLMTVAQKIQHLVRPADLAARIGGDEFVILLEYLPNIQTATQLAERILEAFEHPLSIDGHSVFTTTSIGLVWGDRRYTQASDLLRDADIALYRAKAKGRSRYEIFDEEMHIAAVKRMTLERDLRLAIKRQEFSIDYQPIVDLKAHRLTGFEALIRWEHPIQGRISPSDFIPIAEETGLIVAISQWVLRSACAQVATWQQQFPDMRDLRISINLSEHDLRQVKLVERIQNILDQTQLPATSLTLEITESLLIENVDATIALLNQLRALGIRISIDDFGTGYSSLSYLYNLPADYLKIDQSFVGKMQPGNKNYKIVQAVVSLSDQLQLAAIGEGIETQQQLKWLQKLGCELGQGYLLSRPLTAAAAAYLLAQGRTLAIYNVN